ncbi:MAG: glutaminyl-peptide cyclotransferase [Thermodesulfobacteriota bacterium]
MYIYEKNFQKIKFGFPAITFVFISVILILSCGGNGGGTGSSSNLPISTFVILDSFPHDTNAFTQGLVYDNGFIIEGTGLIGASTLRRTELETGVVLLSIDLGGTFFGEGVTVFEDIVIQLTLSSNTGFVYDKESFGKIDEFSYPTQGWGITHDGNNLIMSDGTSTIRFLNAETFETLNSIQVLDGDGQPVGGLNELEFVEGEIYANVFPTDMIARISPQTGQIIGWIDLTGLFTDRLSFNDVTNGIAYDKDAKRLFVTGKRWPEIFQIDLIEMN